MRNMGIISSIVHELSNFIEVDKKITRNMKRVHPSIKIVVLGLINILASQFLVPIKMFYLVLIMLLVTASIHGMNRVFFKPFLFLLLFSMSSSGVMFLIRIEDAAIIFNNFTMSNLVDNSVVGIIVGFNTRILAMLWVTRVFLFSTPMPDFLHGLRAIKIPRIIVNLIAMTYRYIFVIAGEFLAVSIAKELRAPAARSLKERFADLSVIYASTFNRALRRSSAVQIAMSLRGTFECFTTRPASVSAIKSIAFILGTGAVISFLFLVP
jgi:cobalt/nickel transport system permease protein